MVVKLDPKRKARQETIIKRWRTTEQGTAECATGFGKTTTALIAIGHLQKEMPDLHTLVVVPTKYLRDQWASEIRLWGIKQIEVWVINSVIQKSISGQQQFRCDLLILDEIHAYTSEVFGKVFDEVSYDRVFGLTGTIPENDEKQAIIEEYCPVIDRVPIAECIEKGWVSPFVVYNLALTMTPEERAVYSQMNQDYHKFFAVFGHDFNLAMSCLKNEAARVRYGRQINWKPEDLRIHAVNWRRNMSARMDFLYNFERKIEVGLDLIEKMPEAKTLCFSQTVDFADLLVSEAESRGIEGSASFHSKSTGESAADLFKDTDDVRILSTAKALDQGANIPHVDFLLILSGTSSVLQEGQRHGRGIRYVEGKRTLIVEIYVKGTQEEKWLKKRQMRIPPQHVRYVSSIEEILSSFNGGPN